MAPPPSYVMPSMKGRSKVVWKLWYMDDMVWWWWWCCGVWVLSRKVGPTIKEGWLEKTSRWALAQVTFVH